MAVHNKQFYAGVALLTSFLAVLVIIFLPIFDGRNGLNYLDALYNSISKESANYMTLLKEQAETYVGEEVHLKLEISDQLQAEKTLPLFLKGGAKVAMSGNDLRVQGDLGGILKNCLEDADWMFYNRGSELEKKYGYAGREVLFNWWRALKAMDNILKKQKKFVSAQFISTINQKAVECAYNYNQIEPQSISSRIGVVLFSLVFYVIYTIWYGFAIMLMFEGMGLKLAH